MMRLNHVNLAVPDVAKTRAFFEQFFGLRCTETKGQDVLSVLRDESGFILILSNFQKDVTPAYPRDFHIGFIQETNAQVTAIHERMKSAGVEAPAPKHAHGSWGFYVTAPAGISVEVASYETGA
jgi:catechol 2,3-dioxygenase-like lactoylglutathione lyase family enzyme